MKAEIITVGDELLIGQVVNTNQAYIAERLNTVGIYTERMTTVGDSFGVMLEAFTAAFSRSDVVCVTGGLGPTHDDITKQVVATFFGTDLVMNDEALASIVRRMAERNIPVSESSRNQALVPRTAAVIPNENGAAPGMMFERDGKYFFVMPGVPVEMKGMVDGYIVPLFMKKRTGSVVLHRTLKTTGIAESLLAERIGTVESVIGADGSATLAFLPSQFGTRLRITVRSNDLVAAQKRLEQAEAALRTKAGRYIYAADDSDLEDTVGHLLRDHSLTLSVAESCTGGLIAHRITNVPGSSEYFLRGFVVYSNRSKVEELQVPDELIGQHGAVSKEVATAMAVGCRMVSGSDIALSVTGIAGPSGGTPEKPVGTAWIGYADTEAAFALTFNFGDDRIRFKERASQAALDLLRRKILKIQSE